MRAELLAPVPSVGSSGGQAGCLGCLGAGMRQGGEQAG